MSSKGLGMTGVVDAQGKLIGIYTDGDLRRTLAERTSIDTPIAEVMTASPITARPDVLAAELVGLMKQSSISAIIVTDNDKAVGALNMQDLLRAGVL
jgi:arabinose-5-phosphate isomerase